jgi:cobalt/nickel transport system permease protein
MHIPDSMLSPSTCAVCGIAMAPVWITAAAKVKRSLKTREVPLLALGAAFCFTIMMFNIPALGGSTAHPVAGTLLAVLLGPWAAVIGISVSLAIQALFFGDGGIFAFGANCFTMAFALPMVGYGVYLLLTRRLGAMSRFRPICAGIASYIAINAAASLTAVLLGIQPALFHEANGHAIYFPFGLAITLPAMLSTHLLIAGPAEAVVTALAVAYLQSASIPLYMVHSKYGSPLEVAAAAPPAQKALRYERLLVAFGAIVALTPLGLLATGDAWGEWDAAGVKAQIKKVNGAGYVPRGIASAEKHNYKGVAGLTDYGSTKGRLGYLGAAIIGVTAIALTLTLAGTALSKREEGLDKLDDSTDRVGGHSSPRKTVGADGPLPGWLAANKRPDALVRQFTESGSPNQFLARSVTDLAKRCSTALAGETWPMADGLLQQRDARAKLLGIMALIGVVSASHNLLPILCVYVLTLLAAGRSLLPIALFARRVWLSVPVFVGGVTLPVVLNTVTPGHELITIWRYPHLAVTGPGLLQATVLVSRVGVAVSLAALLTLTTRWSDMMSALRAFFVPRMFVDMLAMTYRYAILLMNTAFEMFVARTSRTVGRPSNSEGRRFVAVGIGSLFGKTLALSEEVHGAMVSRGFTGDVRTLRKPVWRVADTLLLASVLLIAVAALMVDHWIGARA